MRHAALVEALRDAGLDESVARELAPRHAFSRACKRLARERIIRPLREDQTSITFQFTRESRGGGRFEYELETLLTLDKATGTVSCDLPGLATLAQEHLDECIAARNGGDVTRVIQRLFERNADLFPIRERGGVYFTPAEHAPFVDRVQAFLGKVNGRLSRFRCRRARRRRQERQGRRRRRHRRPDRGTPRRGRRVRHRHARVHAGACRGAHPPDAPQDRGLRLLPRRGARPAGA